MGWWLRKIEKRAAEETEAAIHAQANKPLRWVLPVSPLDDDETPVGRLLIVWRVPAHRA